MPHGQAHLERLDIGTSLVTVDPISIAIEGALWGSIRAHGMLPEIAIVSDDTGQFAVGRHAFCRVHAEPLVHKLDTFTNLHRAAQKHARALTWHFYDYLKEYHADPTARRRGGLRARIDPIFRRCTGTVVLGRLLMRLHANKPTLLIVLDRPEIPLNANGSEHDIRLHVIKRKISGGTRSLDSRGCHDAFLSSMGTAAKLGIAFWGYLGDRLTFLTIQTFNICQTSPAVAASPHEARVPLLGGAALRGSAAIAVWGVTTAESELPNPAHPQIRRNQAHFVPIKYRCASRHVMRRIKHLLMFVPNRGPRMNAQYEPDHELEDRLSGRLLDVFIRGGLVVVLVLLCYLIFSPFLTMMLWALILAITIYPLHQMLAARIGGKQGLAATLIVLLAVGVIVTPTIMLASEFGDSVQNLIKNVRDNTLQIPAPSEKVAAWPVVGERVHAVWSQAHNDLPGLVQSMQPKLGELATKALGIVAALGGSLLMFLFSFVVAGIIMAYGESGARAMQEIFERIAGIARGEEFTKLSTATVRAVASGVIGIACIQALIIGVSLMIAGVPFAGVLAVVVLVFGVAQLPALIVTLPVIGWIWASGEYGTGPAVAYTVLLFVGGMADNVLKPLMLGRGVDAPMPVILIGALGGMATTGILGMFVGATGLALGYQIFMRWVHDNPERARQTAAGGSPSTR